jgi:hypothetical protein
MQKCKHSLQKCDYWLLSILNTPLDNCCLEDNLLEPFHVMEDNILFKKGRMLLTFKTLHINMTTLIFYWAFFGTFVDCLF